MSTPKNERGEALALLARLIRERNVLAEKQAELFERGYLRTLERNDLHALDAADVMIKRLDKQIAEGRALLGDDGAAKI